MAPRKAQTKKESQGEGRPSLRTRKTKINYNLDYDDWSEEEVKPVKKSTRGRKRKDVVVTSDEESPDEEVESEEEVKPMKKATRGRKRKDASALVTPDVPVKKEKTDDDDASASTSVASTSEEAKANLKKIKFSGNVPVDEHCIQCSSGYHVYCDPSGDVFNAMLNQTNIGFNNNKYYLLQIIKHITNPEYIVWFRWGRIGKVAGTAIKRHGGNLDAAKKEFEKKFLDKTKNYWEDRGDFEKVQGKYDLLQMDYGEEDEDVKQKEEEAKKMKKEKKEVESKLDKRVADVIDLIFNMKEFEAAVKEMEYDVKKAPLGKLTTKQITAGYESLKKVEACLQKKDFGRKMVEACSEFYTRIPHDFGMRCPPLIRTPAELKLKIQLLEALSDIQIAIQMIKDEKEQELNPKDIHYESLGCKLEPYDSDHEEYEMVKEYIANSHGSTHTQYELELDNVFKVVREEENKRFKKELGNRMLLWHGSRLTNWCGILKQGLRIAPPEAPSTGYMFGKGVYFADVVSKSANYCFANKRRPTGFLLLCEVALGKTCDKTGADYSAARLPAGLHSTKGVGWEVPTPEGSKSLACGTIVPLGKLKTDPDHYALQYNEYVVYDVAQVRARYLVKVNFKYKDLW